jgi:hypothetical protein
MQELVSGVKVGVLFLLNRVLTDGLILENLEST